MGKISVKYVKYLIFKEILDINHSSTPHNTSLNIYTQNFQYKILKYENIFKNFKTAALSLFTYIHTFIHMYTHIYIIDSYYITFKLSLANVLQTHIFS